MITHAPSTDDLFEALADGKRRLVLSHLLETGEANIEELAEVVERPSGEEIRTDGNGHGTVTVQLRHAHLPKLADANLVDYEPGAGRVEYVGGSEIAGLLASGTNSNGNEP